MTRYRVAMVGLFLAITVVVRLCGIVLPAALLALLTGWVALAAVVSVASQRMGTRIRAVQRLSTLQHAVDITILTAIYRLAGGGWWMGGVFYAIPLFFTSMSAPRRHAVALALYASAAYAALLLAQAGSGAALHAGSFLGMLPPSVSVATAAITAVVAAVTMIMMAVLPERFLAFANRSAERHRVLLDASQEGVWATDARGRTQHVNARMAEMVGRTREELARRSLLDLAYDAEARLALDAAIDRCLAGARDVSEQRLRHRDGSVRWMRVSMSPVVARDARAGAAADGVLAMLSDVTERRQAEEALARSEASARSFVENAPYGIYRSTLDGRFLAVNRALVRLLGYDSDRDLLGVRMATDVYGDPATRTRLIERAFERGDAEPVEIDWKRRDGSPLTIRLGYRRVSDAAGDFLYWEGFVEDVTELRAAERALHQKEEQLRLAQRLEAVGQLAGGVAHDFNNLMTVVKVTSDLLLDEMPAGDPLRADVQEIHRAADSAAALTRQLLAFSRRQVLQPRVLDLGAVVAGMRPMLARLVGANVSVTVAPAERPAGVRADPGQLEQVIMNLVVNARDAMPDGGALRIATRHVVAGARRGIDGRDEPGMPEELAPGAYVALSVSDEGTGIDEVTQARIFEPFFTTKPQGAGTGLGLSTVYGIVQQSGGQIAVRSRVGRGTTFTVYLPSVALPDAEPVRGGGGDAAAIASDARAATATATATATVLLVEDQEPLRHLARRILQRAGYDVREAVDGADALRLWGGRLDEIDLLLTDVIMPNVGGHVLAERMRALRPDLRVVFMSGYTDGALGAGPRGELAAGDGFVGKPFTPELLAAAVRDALAAGPERLARQVAR